MGAALVPGEGVDLVHDHRVHAGEGRARALRSQIEIQRLRRGDEQIRGPAQHRLPLTRGRVAGAHRHANRRRLIPELPRHVGDLRQRLLQIGANVDRQRLQRTEIHHARDPLNLLPRLVRVIKRVDRRQEARQRLTRARRSADQRVPATENRRPASQLGVRRSIGKPALEPRSDGRVEPLDDTRGTGRRREQRVC